MAREAADKARHDVEELERKLLREHKAHEESEEPTE